MSMLSWLILACVRPRPLPPPEFEDQVAHVPRFRVGDATEVPWDGTSIGGVVPSDLVATLERRRSGRIRFNAESDDFPAVLHTTFEPSAAPMTGRTVAAPKRPDWEELFADPNTPPPACAHDTPTLELRGRWSFELRSRGRWVAADVVFVRILTQGADPSASCVITQERTLRAALPAWPADRMGAPEATTQWVEADPLVDLDGLVLRGTVDRDHGWTFVADPLE